MYYSCLYQYVLWCEEDCATHYENRHDRSGFTSSYLISAVCNYAACDDIPVHDRWPASWACRSSAVCVAPFCFGTATGMSHQWLPFSGTAEDSQGRRHGWKPDRRYDASGRNGIYAGTPGREYEVICNCMHGSVCWPPEAKTLQSCVCAPVGVGRVFANHSLIEASSIQSKPAIAYHRPKSFASCTRYPLER